MTKMISPDPSCVGATMERSGKKYDADRLGFVHVDDTRDAKNLRAAGYVQVGGAVGAASKKYWECPRCGWEALIDHCPKCDAGGLIRHPPLPTP